MDIIPSLHIAITIIYFTLILHFDFHEFPIVWQCSWNPLPDTQSQNSKFHSQLRKAILFYNSALLLNDAICHAISNYQSYS